MNHGYVDIRVKGSDATNVKEVLDIIATAVKAVDYKIFDDVVITVSTHSWIEGESLGDLVKPRKEVDNFTISAFSFPANDG